MTYFSEPYTHDRNKIKVELRVYIRGRESDWCRMREGMSLGGI